MVLSIWREWSVGTRQQHVGRLHEYAGSQPHSRLSPTLKKMNDTAQQKYQTALQYVIKTGRDAKKQAIYAHSIREDAEAVEAAEAAWNRNSIQPLILAVEYLPELFKKKTAKLDTYLKAFAASSVRNKFDRATLLSYVMDGEYELWQMLEDVRAVNTRKPREPKQTLADKLQAFICDLEKESECGAGLELVCQRRAIADQLRGLLTAAVR